MEEPRMSRRSGMEWRRTFRAVLVFRATCFYPGRMRKKVDVRTESKEGRGLFRSRREFYLLFPDCFS